MDIPAAIAFVGLLAAIVTLFGLTDDPAMRKQLMDSIASIVGFFLGAAAGGAAGGLIGYAVGFARGKNII